MRPLETTLFRTHRNRILCWPRGRKWVKSDMRPLETSLFRLYPSHILDWSRGRKWVPSDWRPVETSLSRHHQRRILGLSRGRIWLLSAICHLNRRFINLKKIRIFGWSTSKKLLQFDIWQLESSLFRIHQFEFSPSPEAENKFRMPFLSLKHRFSTSGKSHFGMVKRKKLSSKCQTTPWNIVYSTLLK